MSMLGRSLHRIRHSSWYSRTAHILAGLRFRARRRVLVERKGLAATSSAPGTAWGIIRLVLRPFFYALVVALALAFVIPRIPVHPHLEPLARLLFSEQDKRVYTALLTTIAATGGVFLALYFTALTVVASTSYAGVTDKIRRLVMLEPLGTAYFRVVAHLTAVSLLGLTILVFGGPASQALLVYAMLLGGVAIFAFFPLGLHRFKFFDPRMLLHRPQQDFVKWLKAATVSGVQWRTREFQDAYRRRALDTLKTLRLIAKYARSGPQPREVITRDVAKSMLSLLVVNALESRRIPSQSLWFQRTQRFSPWGFVSSTETSAALHTGGSPAPRLEADYAFVDSEITRIVVDVLRALLESGAMAETADLMFHVNLVAKELGRVLAVSSGLSILNAMQSELIGHIANSGQGLLDGDRATLGSLNAVSVGFLGFALSAAQAIEEKPIEWISETVRDLRKSRRRLLARGHPRQVVQRLEESQERLTFEKETEGRLLSADWYLEEIVAAAYANFTWRLARDLVDAFSGCFVGPAKQLAQCQRVFFTAELLQDGIEALTKMRFRIEALQHRYHELAERVRTKDYLDPAEWGPVEAKLESNRMELLGQLADLLPGLCLGQNREDLPDYVGYARAMLNRELVRMMVNKKNEGFEQLFPGALLAGLSVVDRHLAMFRDGSDVAHMNVALDTALDILGLSGVAFLFSELHGTDFWQTVKGKWEVYLNTHRDATNTIRLLYAAVEMRLTLPIYSPSAMERQKWHRAFVQEMARAGVRVDRYEDPYDTRQASGTEHSSDIIRSLHPHMGTMFADPCDYFVAFYLSKRPEASGLTIPQRSKTCLDDLERETQRRARRRGRSSGGVGDE